MCDRALGAGVRMPEMTTVLSSLPQFGSKGDQQSFILRKLPENNRDTVDDFVLQIWQRGAGSSRAGWRGWPFRHSPTGRAWIEMPMSPLQSEGVLGVCLEGCTVGSLHGAALWRLAGNSGGVFRWAEAVSRWHQGQRSTVCPR